MKFFPEAKIVVLKENLGWGAGNNRGVESSKGDYLWFLNNDLEVEKESLTNLVQYMKTNPEVGICVPLEYFYSDKHCLSAAGNNFDRLGHVSRIGTGIENPIIPGPYDITYAGGAALFIKREVYNAIGGFDEDIFVLAGDMDIPVRCWIYGYKVRLNPSSKMYHLGSATLASRMTGNDIRLDHAEGLIYFMLKDLQVRTLVTAIPSFILFSFT